MVSAIAEQPNGATTVDGQQKVRRAFSTARGFAETFLYVRNLRGKRVPFQYNAAQRIINTAKREALANGKAARFLIPKARRMGVTTYEQAVSFAQCLNFKGQHCVTLADETKKAQEIFSMVELFHQHLPDGVKPPLKYDTKNQMAFKGVDSNFYIGTAGGQAFGRGNTLQRVHGSEVAFWLADRVKQKEELDKLLTGLTEAASHGEIVLESTANGAAGYWYELVTEASRGENEWTVIFLPWFIFPQYQRRFSCLDERKDVERSLEDDERALVNRHGLTLEQINWRRSKRAERAMRRLFFQEYPETLANSFLASSSAYYNQEVLQELALECREPVTQIDGMTIWVNPEKGHTYAAGMDTSEGVEGGDYTAMGIIDRETGEQVARLHGLWRPAEAATRVVKWCKRYNFALLGIEDNNTGHAVLTEVMNTHHYPRLYYRRVMQKGTRKMMLKPGWRTEAHTRGPMLEDLRAAIYCEEDAGVHLVNDNLFLGEAAVFEDSGKVITLSDGGGGRVRMSRFEARKGFHDDCIIAWSIAHQVALKGSKNMSLVAAL